MTQDEFNAALKAMADECDDKKPCLYYFQIPISDAESTPSVLMAKGYFISGPKEAQTRLDGIKKDILEGRAKAE